MEKLQKCDAGSLSDSPVLGFKSRLIRQGLFYTENHVDSVLEEKILLFILSLRGKFYYFFIPSLRRKFYSFFIPSLRRKFTLYSVFEEKILLFRYSVFEHTFSLFRL
jgi:hypothetical protein